MEIYEDLTDLRLEEVEPPDLIRIYVLSPDEDAEEGIFVADIVHVKEKDFPEDGMVRIQGFSEVFNDNVDYTTRENQIVTLLGG